MTTKAKTVVGLYDDIADAQRAIESLTDRVVRRDDVSFVANAAAEEYGRYFDEGGHFDPSLAQVDDDDLTRGEGAVAGATIGATLGGFGGLLLGFGMLFVPGVGPALAAGPIASTLVGAGVGAGVGGLVGALVNSGVPDETAGHYAEGVRRGGALVLVEADNTSVGEIADIINHHHPVDIKARVARWRQDGYSQFDPKADPYSAEQIAQEHQRYGLDDGSDAPPLEVPRR